MMPGGSGGTHGGNFKVCEIIAAAFPEEIS